MLEAVRGLGGRAKGVRGPREGKREVARDKLCYISSCPFLQHIPVECILRTGKWSGGEYGVYAHDTRMHG